MKHSIFCQTSVDNITERERSYTVSVYCKVELNEALFKEMNTPRAIQCRDAVKTQTMRVDAVIPKSKVTDEYDLLATAECCALTHFISKRGCNALGMIDFLPRNSDLNLMVSQTLTAELLASDPICQQKLINRGDIQAVKACDCAAVFLYTAQVQVLEIPWQVDSISPDVAIADYNEISTINQVVHNMRTYVIDSRTLYEFLNIPLHRYQRDYGVGDFTRPLETVKKLLRKANPVANPETCSITKRLRSRLGDDCYTLLSDNSGPIFIQIQPENVSGQWVSRVYGFRRLYSERNKQMLKSKGYAVF